MNEKKLADVIILARGGGSLEDLWPFNEEIVAKAIYNSSLPIISAVGHETDFSISDFVADLRAPTPSAAAELAVPDIEEVKLKIQNYSTRYKLALKKKLQVMRLEYEKCMQKRAFANPLQIVNDYYVQVDKYSKILESSINDKLNVSKTQAMKWISKLDALSPLKTLTRGYSIAQKQGKMVKSVNDLEKNDEFTLRLSDGQINAKVI